MRDVQNSFTSGSQEKFVYSISTGAKDFPPYLKRVSTLLCKIYCGVSLTSVKLDYLLYFIFNFITIRFCANSSRRILYFFQRIS